MRVVVEVGVEIADQALPDVGVENRKHDFDTTEEVPVHPVRAGAIDLNVAVVVEVVATCVFEEPADDRADA